MSATEMAGGEVGLEDQRDGVSRLADAVARVGQSGYGGGFAGGYDAHCPSPPPILVPLLCGYARTERPRLVVDLGSGTGLSTRFWAPHADEVVGVEPNDAMRAVAEEQTGAAGAPSVRFAAGWSFETGLPDGCADVVTCAQALHWMEPAGTFAEVGRILRPGGVFAAYDYTWPPAMDWELEAAFGEVMARVGALFRDHPQDEAAGPPQWDRSRHLERMRESGRFRFAREVLLHGTEVGSAARLVGMTLSQGAVSRWLRAGWPERDLAIDRLRAEAARLLGGGTATWLVSYRLRVGVV